MDMRKQLKFLFTITALLISAASSMPVRAQAILTEEHTDLGSRYDDGKWSLRAYDEENIIGYKPDRVLLYVNPIGKTTRPAGSSYDFIGVGAGQNYYRISQNITGGLLYLGFNAYENSAFSSYDPYVESDGRIRGNWPWIRWHLVSVKGPGHFSIWQSGDEGPLVLMSSFQNGVDPTDSVWIVSRGHIHLNWGFTAKGVYEVELKCSGYVGGQYVESCPQTYYFGVDMPTTTYSDLVVSAVFDKCFYAQSKNRAWGILVGSSDSVSVGYTVSISGYEYIRSGERTLVATSPVTREPGTEPKPLFTTLKNVGGTQDASIQTQVPTTSLLLKVAGKIRRHDDRVYIDDGSMTASGSPGTLIAMDLLPSELSFPEDGRFTVITGIGGMEKPGCGETVPVIRPRDQNDILPL
jgi:surface-anchored protein